MMDGPADDRTRALGRELRALHARIRELLEDARDGLDATAGAVSVTDDPLARCRRFCLVLDAHHTAEDEALFPWVVAARPELVGVVRRLEEDHRAIATLLADLRRDLDEGATGVVVVRHLEGLAAVMENHFRYEERELVDLLEAAGPDAVPGLGPGFWDPT